MSNPYEILGVQPNAGDAVVEAAFKALVKEHHPDSGGNAEEFKEIKEAYEKITSGEADTSGNGSDHFIDPDGFLGMFDTPIDTQSVSGTISSGLVIEGDYLELALIGLFQTDVEDIVYDHQVEEATNTERMICIFHARNISDRVLGWYPEVNTKFIGDNGRQYTYETNLQIPPPPTGMADLPTHLKSFEVELEPSTHANHITIIEELPDGVKIDRVVQEKSIHAPGSTSGLVRDKERFEFNIKEGEQQEILELPET